MRQLKNLERTSHQTQRQSSLRNAGTSLGITVLGTMIGAVDNHYWFFLVLANLVIMVAWQVVELLGTTFVILALSHRKGLSAEQYLTLVRAVLRSKT